MDNIEIKLPEGLSPELAETFSKPEVMEALKLIVSPLMGKRDELLGQLATHKKTLNELGDIESVRTKLSAYDQAEAAKREAESKAALASNDVESVKKSLQEIIASKDKELEALRGEKVTGHVQSQLSKAFGDHVIDMDLAEPHIKRLIKHAVQTDGSVTIQAFKEDGTQLLTAEGQDASVKDLVAYMKSSAKYAPLFKADNKTGSGARPGSNGVGGKVDNPFAKGTPAYSVTRQMQMIKTDKTMALSMAQAAGVTLKL